MIDLGVNIDHIATLRQARRGVEPDPVLAVGIVEGAGSTGVTVHLREDQRHIQERDVRLIRQVVPVVEDHPYRAANNAPAKAPVAVFPGNGSQRRRPRGGRRPGMSAS